VVTTPGQSKEILRAGDEPARALARLAETSWRSLPEWDYRLATYRRPGAIARNHAAAGRSQLGPGRPRASPQSGLARAYGSSGFVRAIRVDGRPGPRARHRNMSTQRPTLAPA
jgi:hypothetical protein